MFIFLDIFDIINFRNEALTMYMKKKALAFVICLFLLVALCIVYIFSELYTESDVPKMKNTDAVTFKTEYESLNEVSIDDEHTYRSLEIPESNPFVYITAEELVKKIDEKETFVVYFGFSSCPWCRSVINNLITSAKSNHIDQIYYVDVKNIRDTYVLDENHNPERTVEGTKGYYDLLERLGRVLDSYANLTYTVKEKKKTVIKEVEIGEKRIYAPSVVVVRDGIAAGKTSGISNKLTNPYGMITEEMNADSLEQFNNLFKLLSHDSCSIDDKTC